MSHIGLIPTRVRPYALRALFPACPSWLCNTLLALRLSPAIDNLLLLRDGVPDFVPVSPSEGVGGGNGVSFAGVEGALDITIEVESKLFGHMGA
jgi:hypothetical protein